MIKRIVCLGAIMIMAFSLFACGNTFDFQKQINDLKDRIELQDGKIEELKEENKALEEKNNQLEQQLQDGISNSIELEQYKTDVKADLAAYVGKMHEADYGVSDWDRIKQFANIGKVDVNKAADKAGVDIAIKAAKDEISAVPKMKAAEQGFYNLDDAYDLRLLNVEDLKNIAYYYNHFYDGDKDEDETFVPAPKNPEILSAETEYKIKQDYLEEFRKLVPEAEIDGVWISRYYGTHRNCVAVEMFDKYLICHDPLIIPEFIVGGVSFFSYASGCIQIWYGPN